jgi:maltooligosyltrehalose synthase
VKQAVIARALRLRRAAPGLFTQGSYLPLKIEGPAQDHALGFARVHEGFAALVLVTRLPGRLSVTKGLPKPDLKGTHAVIPRNFVLRRTFDAMQSEASGPRELSGRLPLDEVLATCPVALLEVR